MKYFGVSFTLASDASPLAHGVNVATAIVQPGPLAPRARCCQAHSEMRGVPVTLTLPSTVSLTQLAQAPPELLSKGGAAAVNKMVQLMRPLLPKTMQDLEPRELDGGLASLQADIVQCMEENVKQHCVPSGCHDHPPESGTAVVVQAQHRIYHVGKWDLVCFARQIARSSTWLKNTIEVTKSLPEPSFSRPNQRKLHGFRYNNIWRVEALVMAMVQVLCPHFSECQLRHPDDSPEIWESCFYAYKS